MALIATISAIGTFVAAVVFSVWMIKETINHK